MECEFAWGISRVIEFPMIKAGSNDFAASGDWTPATGDTKISKNGGNFANTSNNPSAVGGTGSVGWTLTLTAAEMQCERWAIQIVDSATKAVEDQFLLGYLKDAHKTEYYVVTNASQAPTATDFEADRATILGRSEEATANHFKGRLVQFLTGALQGQMTRISGYALQNSRGYFTVTTLTEAPANGDILIIF